MSQSLSYNDILENAASFYNNNKNDAMSSYNTFREKANRNYIEALKNAWSDYSKLAPIPKPKEYSPIPPKPYIEPIESNPISVVPEEVPVVPPTPRPQPIEPIQENDKSDEQIVRFSFYGINDSTRMPKFAKIKVQTDRTDNIANAWHTLCNDVMDNTIYDVLKMRDKYNLCDWAYLQLLDTISNSYCDDKNGATLLMAFLYCQSGYQMRLAQDRNNLYMLFGSQHQIYDKSYFVINGETFYPYGEPNRTIKICPYAFEGETPLSLIIAGQQNLGTTMSKARAITSERYPDLCTKSQVPTTLIDFYNSYPTSSIGENTMTRWAMYANTPLAQTTKDVLYPALEEAIRNLTKLDAVNRLLNWVQTGFEYEYDDIVWGYDRAFFSEETLYYPYCDCEDRSILFSRLVRDLLGLDVALIYYPGHLATAVKFDTEGINGDSMIIGGNRYIVCDPTYIGAPVGKQMPSLKFDETEAIILQK